MLLNYSADPSAVDLTRTTDDMIQILKREQTIVELSENENDDDESSDSLSSSSSSMNSADEFEQDEKNLSESSITNQVHSFELFDEPAVTKRNPYDFESDDEHESKHDFKFDESTVNDIDDNYRVPPLRIILARTILTNIER